MRIETDGTTSVKVGDTVTIETDKGIVRTGKVNYVCFWDFWDIELVECNDRYGNYGHWKQRYDGGKITKVIPA